jgi:LuxR family maltose regulon positive regulatory protein
MTRKPRQRQDAAQTKRRSKSQPSTTPDINAQIENEKSAPPIFILRTKLLPPRPAPELLPRPRLTERLNSNLAHPVTLVAANAGSGKTTLVADFVRTHAKQFVWYQLDHTDADPFVFLGYITQGIRQAVAGFGDVTTSYLQESASELAQEPERAVDVLLNEVLERVEHQLILVLDDYHHLGAETRVHHVVDRLLAYLPDVMHVIIISRDVPPLSLARLRSQSSLNIIERNELLFTDEETHELFQKVFDLELTPAQLIEYRERTHGWITALQLVRQVAQRQHNAHQNDDLSAAAPPDLSEILRQSERDIFDYFAEEVFADEAVETQNFLLHLSLLERIELEACRHLFADVDSDLVLPALVRRNVFVTLASDERGEEYRVHPLFRSFLRRRLRVELGQAGWIAEHSRLADYYLAHQKWEQAMLHLLAAEDYERAAVFIAERGGEWIATGALFSLVDLADALPPVALEAHPRALSHRAEVARLRGDYDAATTRFHRAATLLREQRDTEGEAEALHALASIARRRGENNTAFAYLDRAVELTNEASPVRIKCGNTRGLCLMATGDLTAAEREFRVALQTAEEQGDERYVRLIAHNLGLPAAIRGDFGEALRWTRRMLSDKTDSVPLPQEATAHLNIARFHLYRGDTSACEQHLDRALELSQLFNLRNLRGEIFETYGNLYRELNEPTRAREFYARAARAYADVGIDIHRTELLEEQAQLQLQLGDLQSARANVERLNTSRAGKDLMSRHSAQLARGRIMLAQNEYADAALELAPALHYFREQQLYYYEAQAQLALASCTLAAGNESAMLNHLRRVLDLAARYDYEYWLQRELPRHAALLAHQEVIELLPADLREHLRLFKSASATQQRRASDLVIASKSVTDLTINLLGTIEIFRDPARPLAADAWITKRARDILCFIASRPHRRVSKDTIIDTFWGEADTASVEKNFHPTISHIRKALNSNQPLKQNFLLYRDGDYQLNAEFSYHIDIEEFDRLSTEAEAARRARDLDLCTNCYEQAIPLYRGEFMKGSYDDWAEEQRAYYQEQHLRILEALAAHAQQASEWERSLQLAQRILHADPFREDIHCLVMRAHAALNNRAAVKDQYETLRRLLHKELGVEPASETRKVFQDLMR